MTDVFTKLEATQIALDAAHDQLRFLHGVLESREERKRVKNYHREVLHPKDRSLELQAQVDVLARQLAETRKRSERYALALQAANRRNDKLQAQATLQPPQEDRTPVKTYLARWERFGSNYRTYSNRADRRKARHMKRNAVEEGYYDYCVGLSDEWNDTYYDGLGDTYIPYLYAYVDEADYCEEPEQDYDPYDAYDTYGSYDDYHHDYDDYGTLDLREYGHTMERPCSNCGHHE